MSGGVMIVLMRWERWEYKNNKRAALSGDDTRRE
jgi:hypothetical protein